MAVARVPAELFVLNWSHAAELSAKLFRAYIPAPFCCPLVLVQPAMRSVTGEAVLPFALLYLQKPVPLTIFLFETKPPENIALPVVGTPFASVVLVTLRPPAKVEVAVTVVAVK